MSFRERTMYLLNIFLRRERRQLLAYLSLLLLGFATWCLWLRLPQTEFKTTTGINYENDKLSERQALIYNRIAKTGSTSLANLVYSLWQRNDIGLSFLNVTQNAVVLSKTSQQQLVNLSERSSRNHPFLLHGHFHYVNFKQLGSKITPIYVNMIREPLDRLVSYYYFLRHGDDYRPHVVRMRMRDAHIRQQSFDECVLTGGPDCRPTDIWFQIPHFCGQASYCRVPGDPVALDTAKRRVTEDYLIVGLTEHFKEFVVLLERLLPRFFRGASQLLNDTGTDGWHLRRTRYKEQISNATREAFRANPYWKAEQEFYEFVKDEFWSVYNSMIMRINQHENSDPHWYQQHLNLTKIRSPAP